MLLVTTIYSMDLETAKKLSAEEPDVEHEDEVQIPMEDREFLGIYQGTAKPGHSRD